MNGKEAFQSSDREQNTTEFFHADLRSLDRRKLEGLRYEAERRIKDIEQQFKERYGADWDPVKIGDILLQPDFYKGRIEGYPVTLLEEFTDYAAVQMRRWEIEDVYVEGGYASNRDKQFKWSQYQEAANKELNRRAKTQ